MSVAFSSIPVYMPPTTARPDGSLVPSRDVCLGISLSGGYAKKWVRKPYCGEGGVPDELPDGEVSTNCIGEPWFPSEPYEWDTAPCDPPWYDVPSEPLVLDLYYDGAEKGRVYKMSLVVLTRRWNDGDDVEPGITEYPFEFTAAECEGRIEQVFSVESVPGELACCYLAFPNCSIGE